MSDISDFDLFFEKFTHLTHIGDGTHEYVEGDGSNVVELANANIDIGRLRAEIQRLRDRDTVRESLYHRVLAEKTHLLAENAEQPRGEPRSAGETDSNRPTSPQRNGGPDRGQPRLEIERHPHVRDIVERLRQLAGELRGYRELGVHADGVDDAADEIDRLRARGRNLAETNRQRHSEIVALKQRLTDGWRMIPTPTVTIAPDPAIIYLGGGGSEALPPSIESLSEENEELKQWMSDACELLHEIRPALGGVNSRAVLDLLRRAENP